MAKIKSALGLGKGLNALIPSQPPPGSTATYGLPHDDGKIAGVTAMIEVAKVRPNPWQPRVDFDMEALEDLKKSIKEKGVIQPITVRRVDGGYEIIAGERRIRASTEVGLKEIPAYILDITTDAEMLELALIENVQRENLNPIEVALGYHRLIEECSLTQEEVALKVGKERSTVTNFLRLLRLPEAVQQSVRRKKLSVGHARALLALTSPDLQQQVFRRIMQDELSVRKTEELVKRVEAGEPINVPLGVARVPEIPAETPEKTQTTPKMNAGKSGKEEREENPKTPVGTLLPTELEAARDEIETRLRHVFATQVRLKTKSNESGAVEIEFFSTEELGRLLDLFAIIEKNQG